MWASEDVLFMSVGNSQSLVSTEAWKPYGKLHKHSNSTAVETTWDSKEHVTTTAFLV